MCLVFSPPSLSSLYVHMLAVVEVVKKGEKIDIKLPIESKDFFFAYSDFGFGMLRMRKTTASMGVAATKAKSTATKTR